MYNLFLNGKKVKKYVYEIIGKVFVRILRVAFQIKKHTHLYISDRAAFNLEQEEWLFERGEEEYEQLLLDLKALGIEHLPD